MKKWAVLACFLLVECESAEAPMLAAKDIYVACVKKNPDGCKGEREAYQAELAAFDLRVKAAAAINQ